MVSSPSDESEAIAPVSSERCEVNQAEIARLQRRWVVELEQMERFHRWLEGLASGPPTLPSGGGLTHRKDVKRYALATPMPAMPTA